VDVDQGLFITSTSEADDLSLGRDGEIGVHSPLKVRILSRSRQFFYPTRGVVI
jgi:hypothetical protein